MLAFDALELPKLALDRFADAYLVVLPRVLALAFILCALVSLFVIFDRLRFLGLSIGEIGLLFKTVSCSRLFVYDNYAVSKSSSPSILL